MIGVEIRHVANVTEPWAVHTLFNPLRPNTFRYRHVSQACDKVWQILHHWNPPLPCRVAIPDMGLHTASLFICDVWVDDGLAAPMHECQTLLDTYFTVQRWLLLLSGKGE